MKHQTHVEILLVRTDDCQQCDQVQSSLNEINSAYPNVSISIRKPGEVDHQTFITPAIFINGNLWNYGGVDPQRLSQHLKKYNHLP